jgi:nicotinamide-nucleotide adenylyltransferase
MSKIERALMIGRFQPFHKGHLLLVKDILSDCREIIIAIGSSQFNYTPTNPFTAGERVQMIHESLVENNTNLKRVYVIPVSNSENNAIWLEQLKSTVPKFDIIYSGNEFVKALIENDKRIRLIAFLVDLRVYRSKVNLSNYSFVKYHIYRSYRKFCLDPFRSY